MHTAAAPAASGVAEPQAHRAASADGASPPPCAERRRGAACALFTLALAFSGGFGTGARCILRATHSELAAARPAPPQRRLCQTGREASTAGGRLIILHLVGPRGAVLISGKSA